MKKTLLTLSMFALAACGGGDGDKTNLISNGDGISSITGVWDGTENLGSDGIDENYTVIDKNGLVTFYDYAGDSYDQEGNCYWIGIAQIKSLGNHEFELTPLGDAEDEESAIFTINRTGDKLIIDVKDSEDPDDETVTLTKSNKSANNFTPECEDSSSTHARNKASGNAKLFALPQ